MDINHLTLLTDFYELTMMQGYFKQVTTKLLFLMFFIVTIHPEVVMRSLAV